MTVGYGRNYELSLDSLPDFACLSAYVYTYRTCEYPVYDYAGRYAGSIVYIDNSSRMHYYDPWTGAEGAISAPLTLLYQKSAGPYTLEAQVDNEFQLDTPGDVALLYGNLTTAPGRLTVEAVWLSNGSVRQMTTPVEMGNFVQADYVGGGNVAIFNMTVNGTGVAELRPAYVVNLWNDTSLEQSTPIGFAPDNIYWVWQLHSFIDAQGTMTSQYVLHGETLDMAGRVWLNNSEFTTFGAAQGAVYDARDGRVAIDLEGNVGTGPTYYEILNVSGGTLHARGSYSFASPYWAYIQRYSYTSQHIWATYLGLYGKTVLWDPFNNATLTVPNLLGRQGGSGTNGNYEFTDPNTTSTYLSLNGSLVGDYDMHRNQFVWANATSTPAASGPPRSGWYSTGPLGLPLWAWLGLFVAVAVAFVAGFSLEPVVRRRRR